MANKYEYKTTMTMQLQSKLEILDAIARKSFCPAKQYPELHSN